MDITSFFRKRTLTFVEKTLEKGDIYTFTFTSNKPIKHIAGQHGLFTIPKLATFRIFSLASSPEEGVVKISTHVRKESPFKQRLDSLQKGDRIHMLGPVLNFFIKKEKEVVFLAQGIGITPFRSMILHNVAIADPTTITLIHVDGADHVFRAELEPLANKAVYPTNPDEFTIAVTETVKSSPDATYFISGSPGFNRSAKALLAKSGVKRTQLKTDSFLGY